MGVADGMAAVGGSGRWCLVVRVLERERRGREVWRGVCVVAARGVEGREKLRSAIAALARAVWARHAGGKCRDGGITRIQAAKMSIEMLVVWESLGRAWSRLQESEGKSGKSQMSETGMDPVSREQPAPLGVGGVPGAEGGRWGKGPSAGFPRARCGFVSYIRGTPSRRRNGEQGRQRLVTFWRC